ncbi:hypothetical protein [Nonomuraea gerenzanensis]|uniref:Uncharacterized protein n=1 Tax=Nonomuraea gerenzanensis TaxID=93944 RepID=A0A1M4EBK6_9ACTN|nr:hypothetical protein [Nonomuraea gerenzanensis]UBU18492.1 hypothetical protein LCN96_26775 [Nonomuraea gerenzanensis]SBO96331.1 hypothetical protein BN4615_P5847 [Nonomuraea gerenzanensis]
MTARLARRWCTGQGHFHGVIAITELDHVARHWTAERWGVGRDEMLDVLTESWCGTIGRH